MKRHLLEAADLDRDDATLVLDTDTFCVREVGRFLPTRSARIGSSRCPRSTRTASCTARGRPTSRSASRAARTDRPE